MQLMAYLNGGTVTSCEVSEYGRTEFECDVNSSLFKGLPEKQIGLMSHTDRISVLPCGFTATARTKNCPIAAFENRERRLYGVQFHPEVENTPRGTEIIRNFLYEVCGAAGDYDLHDYEEKAIAAVQEQVGDHEVILGLSGGVRLLGMCCTAGKGNTWQATLYFCGPWPFA